MDLLIVGAGGHAKVVIETVRCMYGSEKSVGIVSSAANSIGHNILGVPIVGTDEDISSFFTNGCSQAFIAVGNNTIRHRLARELEAHGFEFPVLIHPSSVISPSSTIMPGTLIAAGAVIQPDTIIGHHVIVNTAASVDHDCVIEDYAHIAPGARLAGSTIVHCGAHLGIGSVTIQGISIGENSIIGAGSVVIRDVSDHWVAYGNPCKPVRKTKAERHQ